MKRTIKLLFSSLFIILGYSCDDILEDDITDNSIQIVSPNEGSVISGNSVQFLWQDLEGADDYRVQILRDNQVLIVDSLVSSNELNYNLNAGSYLWRVKGENFAYETEYTFPTNFSVEDSEDLTNQVVNLLAPSDDLYTNDSNITLTWSSIVNADSYTVGVNRIYNGETNVFLDADISSTNVSLESSVFDIDAEYIWEVKAVNANPISETLFSERTIFIDRVPPNQPTLNAPTDNAVSTTVVAFNWSNGIDTGNIQSLVTNTIEISTDFDFNSIFFSDDTQNSSFQYTFSDTGIYYWRVKASDKAGNQSDASIVRTLTIE